jgi:hypothetical protein
VSARPLSGPATAAVIAVLGVVVALAGDACHVASHTTEYLWSGVPTVWRSAIWFPVLVSCAVVAAAWASERAEATPARRRGRSDAVLGACLVLALYALTAALRRQPATVSVLLTGALALAVWCWWDPSPGALAVACAAAVAGPLAEIGIVAVGAARYEHGADGLAGVAPWLPCLYFAAGAVASRLWAAVARDGAGQPTSEATTAS